MLLYANIDNTLHYVRTRTQNTQLATIQERLDLKQRTYWLVQWAPLDSILNEYRLSSSVELATFAYKLHTHAHTFKKQVKRDEHNEIEIEIQNPYNSIHMGRQFDLARTTMTINHILQSIISKRYKLMRRAGSRTRTLVI